MKKWIGLVVGLLLTARVWALDINGYLKTDWRMLADGSGKFVYNENDLSLKLKSALGSAGVTAFAELELKNIGFSTTTNLYGLSLYDKTRVAPWTLELKEGYVDLSGLFLKGFDVRAGKQRITWGTADRFNPTDNINPLDFSDVTDLGKRLGTNAIKATYYLGNCYFQGVYVPVFVPAVLPADYQSMYPFPAGVPISDTLNLPTTDFTNSMFAAKAGGKIFVFDSSISYFYGFDNLPLDKKTTISCSGTLPVVYPLNVSVELQYPKIQVIGLDMAGSIGDVGVWVEAGCFLPDKFDTEAIQTHIYFGTLSRTTGTKLQDPYYKYTVGADYTFPFGIYANIQYCHGFFDERGSDIRDYLIAAIERKFFNDKLKITLAGFLEMDFKRGEHFFPSFAGYPEISYSPFEATEILIGAYFLDSWSNGKFYTSRTSDLMYLKVKYSF